MQRSVRNIGNRGIAAMAISAIDIALWDLRARLLHVPLVQLLGAARQSIAAYGSGGFTSYNDRQLQSQLGGWAEQGFPFVKMKVGTHPEDDPRRVRVARGTIGDKVQLFVDANGAYTAKQAIHLAEVFHASNVTWFEEPVSSDDLAGLHFVRSHVPVPIEVAAGDYGYAAPYFENMLAAKSVDVQQADATRAQGITGFLAAAAVCDAHQIALSAHCAPSIHMHACCAVSRARHLEFFHDHARIERMFFDGFCEPRQGHMFPDWSRPGLGLELKEKDAKKFLIETDILALFRPALQLPLAERPHSSLRTTNFASRRKDRMKLQGKVAIVTGAATGIGKAIATGMAAEGAAVVIDYVGAPDLANAVVSNIRSKGGKAMAFEADVSNPDQVNALVSQAVKSMGRLDIFVNNAGIE